MKIANIVFLQNQDDFEGFTSGSCSCCESDISKFFDSNQIDQLNYLVQWDYPPYNYLDEDKLPVISEAQVDNFPLVRKLIGAGESDRVIRIETYYLTLNSRLGYAGLSKLIPNEI